MEQKTFALLKYVFPSTDTNHTVIVQVRYPFRHEFLGLEEDEADLQTICYQQKITIIGLTLTYLNVDGCVAVHPHRKHSILENNSDLIQQLLLQRCTVELLGVSVTENR